MIMGAEDWMGEEHRYAQLVQVMQYMMAMGSQLKQEDIWIEEKVYLQCTRLLVQVIDDVVAGIVDGHTLEANPYLPTGYMVSTW